MPRTITSAGGSGSDEWAEPTRPDGQHDTAPHDLSGVARALATGSPSGDHETVLRMAFDEGAEEAIRALYVVMRRRGRGMARDEMDAIVLAMRAEIVRL